VGLELHAESEELFRITLTGRLTKAEFDQVGTTLASALERSAARIRVLIILEHFEGWEHSEEWADVSFLMEHGNDIAKMAFVGDAKWKDQMLAFVGMPYRSTEMEFFATDQLAAARSWLA